MESSFIKYYSIGVGNGSSFDLSGYGKVGAGPRTTHLNSQKHYCWTYGGDFVLSLSKDYSTMSHLNKVSSHSSIYMMREDKFITSSDGLDGF